MSSDAPIIRRASRADLDALVPLFDGYRVFYDQPSDHGRARAFLGSRLSQGDSVVLLADVDDALAGFTQLYPLFSSVRTGRAWLLNDLFVAPTARRRGVAEALLRAAAAYAADDGAVGLELETAVDNVAAQALYRKLGWSRCEDTVRFQLPVDPGA